MQLGDEEPGLGYTRGAVGRASSDPVAGPTTQVARALSARASVRPACGGRPPGPSVAGVLPVSEAEARRLRR